MEIILLAHAARYPLMKPQDAVKLIYQNEFGGGHLIQDEQACMAFLHREYASVLQNSRTPLTEDIGNGIVRVNLAALDAHGCSVSELGYAFIRSAAAHKGTEDSFRRKLEILKTLTRAGTMPFSPEDLAAYLKRYEAAGFPAVSHSDVYRNAYRPAYRVVAKNCFPRQVL